MEASQSVTHFWTQTSRALFEEWTFCRHMRPFALVRLHSFRRSKILAFGPPSWTPLSIFPRSQRILNMFADIESAFLYSDKRKQLDREREHQKDRSKERDRLLKADLEVIENDDEKWRRKLYVGR